MHQVHHVSDLALLQYLSTSYKFQDVIFGWILGLERAKPVVKWIGDANLNISNGQN